MIKNILISKSKRKIINQYNKFIGMSGENLQEVLVFNLDEEIEGQGIIEIKFPDETKGFIEIEKSELGYELPVKSSLLTQSGQIEMQLRILQNNQEVFKSEIMEFRVKESINATETIPEQYPTWIDNLTVLRQNLEKSEQERLTSEEARVEAETQREETFTQMQESVENAVKEIADKKADYNQNALEKTNEYNELTEQKTNAFNSNAETKTNNFNQNYTEKTTAFYTDVTTKTNQFDTNATNKTTEFNNNAKSKTDTFNSNVETKTNEYNTNAQNKVNEYNLNAQEKMNEYNANAEELTNRITTLESENTSLKNQIPSGEEVGNPIHLTDSSDMECEIVPIGGAEQETRSGKNLIDYTKLTSFEHYNLTVTQIANGIRVTCNTTTPHLTSRYILINLEKYKGKNLTISANIKSSSSNQGMVLLAFCDSNGGNRSDSTYTEETTDGKVSLTKAIPETLTDNTSYLCLMLYGRRSTYDDTQVGEYVDYTNIQLEEGSTATDYEQYGAMPSPDYPSPVVTVAQNGSVEIEVCNKNLAKINEINWELTENNTIKNKAKNDATKLATISLKKGQTVKISIKLKSKPTVDASLTASGMPGIGFIRIDRFELDKANTITYTASEDVEIIYNLWGNAKSETFEFQFWAEIDEATDYIPHKSYTKVLPIQKEFVKIGDVEDTFVKVDGKWYEKHNIKIIDLSAIASSNFYINNTSTSNKNRWGSAYFTDILNNANVLCTHLKNVTNGDTYNCIEGISIDNKTVYMYIEGVFDYTNLNEFLQKGIKLYYPLATPELIPCTAEQEEILNSFYTYKGITNISVDGIGTLKVNYKKDLETLFNNINSALLS